MPIVQPDQQVHPWVMNSQWIYGLSPSRTPGDLAAAHYLCFCRGPGGISLLWFGSRDLAFGK